LKEGRLVYPGIDVYEYEKNFFIKTYQKLSFLMIKYHA